MVLWLFEIPVWYGKILLAISLLLLLSDGLALFRIKKPVAAVRTLPERMSNGDENQVRLQVLSRLPFKSRFWVTEELPEQLQVRHTTLFMKMDAGQRQELRYQIRPVERGLYAFGNTIVLMATDMDLIRRRWVCQNEKEVKVYPSFHHMRQYRLMAQPLEQMEPGSRKLRKIGNSLEFEQIKEYVPGDDRRTINWRATARRNTLMVNHYMDEKSQQVYCLIDKGRLMKMPFNGLSLLDYSINAALALCNVCLHRQDKFGLITFSHEHGTVIAADRKPLQLNQVLEGLYRQSTAFLESDFERLYLQVRRHIKHRSLLVTFTNFESTAGLRRQLPYLRQLARHHLLLVIIFENTTLSAMADRQVQDVESLYRKTIAEKFLHDKRLMVRELQQQGILAMLSTPEKTTINAINKYIEIKSRQAI